MYLAKRPPVLFLRGIISLLLLSVAVPWVHAAETSATSPSKAGPEEREFRRRAKPLEPPERVVPPIEEQAPPYIEPPFGPEDRKFLVKAIHVEGSVLIPEDERKRLVSPYEGQTLTLADLRKLARELTQWLRGHGYVTSRVYIPPQEVTEGVVTIQILEGRVGEIRIEGAKYSRPSMFTRRMATKPGGLLEYRTLQRDLSRLSANPDRKIMAVLVPGKTTGTTDVVVHVEEHFPMHAEYVSHNQGTKLTGRVRQGFTVGHNNLTGNDDQLVVRGEFSGRSEFVAFTASYLLPLGPSGRTVGIDVSRADVELGRHFRYSHVAGDATVVGLTWAEPLWQAESWETEWVSGFDWKRVRSRELGVDTGKDDLRVLRLGPNVLEHDATGRSIFTTEVGIGFDQFLGASHKVDSAASRSQTGGQFTRVTLAGGRLQRLVAGFQMLLRGSCQLSDRRLPPSETIRLGGENTVRGYPEGEILGDYGYVGTAELRFPVSLPRQSKSLLTLVGFVDGGAAFSRKPVLGEDEKKRLLGLGFGLRWAMSPQTTALVDLGFPVGDDSSEGNGPRLHFAVSVGF